MNEIQIQFLKIHHTFTKGNMLVKNANWNIYFDLTFDLTSVQF